MKRDFIKSLKELKSINPVVHSITNYVTVTDVANSIIAIGGSPIMSHAKEDFPELLQIIQATRGALVLNIGTLDNQRIEQMIEAGKIANNQGVPIIVDPVGAGATSYRTKAALRLIENLDISIIKGNLSEIKALTVGSSETRGVDAISSVDDEAKGIAIEAAKKLNCIVAITGKIDFISDGSKAVAIKNGSSSLSTITGTGCMTAGLIGAFSFLDDKLCSAIYGIAIMAIAGEMAQVSSNGPGSFHINLIDAISKIDELIIKEMAKIELV